ncbi:hypothetical protein JTB14_034031 [Gonioctena quinquepunctata]|nr:hypothetical protein JTB14_034031 [Gonioctena quinquepunctata]
MISLVKSFVSFRLLAISSRFEVFRKRPPFSGVRHFLWQFSFSVVLLWNHMHLVTEKNKNNDRISKLEEQLKKLNLSNLRSEDSGCKKASVSEDGSGSARQVLELEREALELRRELQDTRAKKEETDKKVLQLDKKLSHILRRNDISNSDISDDGKTTASIESLNASIVTTSSFSQPTTPRVTLSGPVTDL